MRYYVYLLRDGERVFYVGKGTRNRLYRHVSQARTSSKNSPCLNTIRKIEREGRRVVYEKVFLSNDAEAAYAKEVELIAEYGLENLTNLTVGGEGARRVSTTEEHRRKISARLRQLYEAGVIQPVSRGDAAQWERTKQKISEALRGRPRGPDRPETRARKSEAQRRLWASGKRNHSPEALDRMREAGRRGGLAHSRTKGIGC